MIKMTFSIAKHYIEVLSLTRLSTALSLTALINATTSIFRKSSLSITTLNIMPFSIKIPNIMTLNIIILINNGTKHKKYPA
jgi:hypothetical protein